MLAGLVTVLAVALPLALVSAAPPAAPVPGGPSWPGTTPEALAPLLAAGRDRPLEARLLDVSARFLGTPYAHSPLGEGEGRDPDPRFRLDRVDCLTFVETTLALALSDGPEDVLHVLDALRYRGRPAYEDRNHLMEAEWLPSNVAKGFVRDVTAQLGGDDVRAEVKVLSGSAWDGRIARALALPVSAHPTGRFPLSVLPAAAIAGRAASWPSGTLLLVVREDAPTRVTRISHLGFVIQRDGRTFLRHATRGWKDGVVDEELAHLLGRHARYPWKLAGVSLFEVRDPRAGDAPRVSAAGASSAAP